MAHRSAARVGGRLGAGDRADLLLTGRRSARPDETRRRGARATGTTRPIRHRAPARHRIAVVALIAALAIGGGALAAVRLHADATEPRANGLPVLVHYMPWFAGPSTLGAGHWGWHWTMDDRDPNVVGSDGRRQIASHYSPMIGPYDSADPAVLRYHLLLMKYAGVDGVLIDWYGTQGSNSDVGMLQRNTAALIAAASEVGLRFAVVYEDRFTRTADDALTSLRYAKAHWFGLPGYLRLSSTGEPYLGVFGPLVLRDPAEWRRLTRAVGPVDLRSLWNNTGAGSAADGQFAWPFAVGEAQGWEQRLEAFYGRADGGAHLTAVGYPGYDDYYAQGQDGGKRLFAIPYDGGGTLRRTLQLATTAGADVDSVQIATWNDFGEGTMVEPTAERGFASLDALQRFTGSAHAEGDLRRVLAWYRAATRDGLTDPDVARAYAALVRGDTAAADAALAGR